MIPGLRQEAHPGMTRSTEATGNDAGNFRCMNQASAAPPINPPQALSMHTIAGLI
jgi:hypothetical protein